MRIKYCLSSISIATFTLWIFLHYWPSHATRNGIETIVRKENSNNAPRNGIETIGTNTKYKFFISRLKQSEIDRVRQILDLKLSEGEITMSNQEAKMMFFQTLAQPLQSVCQVLKRIGGHWHFGGPGQHHQVDGDKFICLDPILNQDSCIVYSFGVAGDWTFEDQMDDLGCSVFSYDHTVSYPAQRGRNIKFFKTGLGIGEHLETLNNLIKANHHETSTIDYLKIDIEGYEFTEGGFQDWLSSGALQTVSQIALELHIDDHPIDERQYINLLRILQDLYRLGFRVISQEVNMVKGADETGIYNFLEVVFMKEYE